MGPRAPDFHLPAPLPSAGTQQLPDSALLGTSTVSITVPMLLGQPAIFGERTEVLERSASALGVPASRERGLR